MEICSTLRVWYVHSILQKVAMHVLTDDNEKQISNDNLIKKIWTIRVRVKVLSRRSCTLPAYYEQINKEKRTEDRKEKTSKC